jgi:hypothetical protein
VAEELFERAADAVAFGEVPVLRDLLDRRPALVRDRSARPHRATLLHYCTTALLRGQRDRGPAPAHPGRGARRRCPAAGARRRPDAGCRAAVELLLGRGASADVREERWAASPAGIAAYNGHPALAALLTEAVRPPR